MNIKVFFDFHDIFVDAKSAWIKAFSELTNNEEVINDYNNKMSKKEICKKYFLDYSKVEELYREYLNPIADNIDFAKKLCEHYKINILSMARKDRLLKDIDKFNLKDLFDDILGKEDIRYSTKEEYLNAASKDYDWVIYFNHDSQKVKKDNNIIYLPVNLKGDLSQFKNLSFTEHARNKLLYNDLSKYYMYAIANDTSYETDFLINLYKQNNLPVNGSILDCCCGVGRHDYLLAKAGYKVTGIDISEEQIKNAKKIHSHENADYNVMDVRNINFPKKDYDMAICMWTTYNYLSQDEDFKSFLKSNYFHQHENSLLVLDSKNISRLNNRRVYKRNNSLKDGVKIELLVNKYILENIQNSQYLYFINDNGKKDFYFDEEFVRFYTLDEIESLAKDYYDVLSVYGDFDFSEYDKNNSNRFIVVLKRKK
ncbi:MAG: methyltransferase domain-containing protein [Bacilli bacterium]|nr:methyltransferase domain-containing protein [Bacilli bacterium]MBP3562449.1 methyltransferase domain-containing protein [Treponema sp.]